VWLADSCSLRSVYVGVLQLAGHCRGRYPRHRDGGAMETDATIPTTKRSPFHPQHSSPDRCNCHVCSKIRTEATAEFASTWTCVRAPSPPEAPDAESVRRDFTSCLTCGDRISMMSHYQASGSVGSEERTWEGSTFVTAVPPRKNTTRQAKGAFQGCRAWTTAVRAATPMPRGVRDLRE
jgi:hypothetical protein